MTNPIRNELHLILLYPTGVRHRIFRQVTGIQRIRSEVTNHAEYFYDIYYHDHGAEKLFTVDEVRIIEWTEHHW